MAFRPLPEQALLLQLFRYDPTTGQVTRRCAAKHCSPGDIVGCVGKRGYLGVKIGLETWMVHRLIWKMVTGTDPVEIDHVDGNRANNRIENLRSVSKTENSRNAQIPSNNTSGVVGVYWNNINNNWRAIIKVDGVAINIGSFRTISEAAEARRAKEREIGFHPNHGRSRVYLGRNNP